MWSVAYTRGRQGWKPYNFGKYDIVDLPLAATVATNLSASCLRLCTSQDSQFCKIFLGLPCLRFLLNHKRSWRKLKKQNESDENKMKLTGVNRWAINLGETSKRNHEKITNLKSKPMNYLWQATSGMNLHRSCGIGWVYDFSAWSSMVSLDAWGGVNKNNNFRQKEYYICMYGGRFLMLCCRQNFPANYFFPFENIFWCHKIVVNFAICSILYVPRTDMLFY